MPRETVYGEQHGTLIEGEPKMVPVTEVLWNRDGGYVQVVTKATDPHGGRVAGEAGETHFTDGLYVNLDRGSINALIRHLRRARDQAFGRDE